MIEPVIEVLLGVIGVYLALGVGAAVALHVAGLVRIDPGVSGTGVVFRALVTPGMVALWPLLLIRWRSAVGGAARPVEADRRVAAAVLRRRHLRQVFGLALAVPLLAVAGLVERPGSPSADPSARHLIPAPEPLADVVHSWQQPFTGLPIAANLRGDATGARQLELEVADDLEIPGTMLFFTPEGTDSQVFLGAAWGPGTRRYQLPSDSTAGSLTLYSLGHREQIAHIEIPESGAAPGRE